MKYILLVIFFSTLSFSSPATKDDIKMMIHYMDKRFDAVDKRFDDVNKRFDDVNKRFDDVNKRFEDARNQSDKRFNFMENIMITMIGFIGMVVALGLWDRYSIMKQTKLEIKKEVDLAIQANKEEITLETVSKLKQKVDKVILEKLALILEKVVENNQEARDIFKKHRFIFS